MPRHDRPTDTLDPLVAAELAQLEAALAGAPSADPALAALVADVHEDAVPPSLAFRTELDARVAAGFPAARRPRAWAERLRRPAFGPALGLAAAVLIALVVGVGVLRDDPTGTTASSSLESGATSSVAQDAAPSAATAVPATPEDDAAARKSTPSVEELSGGTAASPTQGYVSPSAPVPPPATAEPGTATPSFGRKVEQTTRLALSTSARKLQEVADGVVRVTQGLGGVVEQSSVDSTDRSGTASFTLTVPTAKAADAVKQLSALAHVASMSQARTDITGSFVSVVDRLSDARAERRALLAALKDAKTPEGIARLRERIRVNRAEVASLKGQLAGLRRRADGTVLSVTVTGRAGAAAGDADDGGAGPWSTRDAAHDALRVLEVAFGVLLVALAIAVPLGLVVLPVSLGARVARRRRREHALDAV